MFKVGDRVGEVYNGGIFDRRWFLGGEYYYGVIEEVFPDGMVRVKWDSVWVWNDTGKRKANGHAVLEKVWLDGRNDRKNDEPVPTYILMLEEEMKRLGNE